MVSIGRQNRSFIEPGRDKPEKPAPSMALAEVFQVGRDASTKPYYMDGDATFYSEDNMVKRDALKDSVMIREAIVKFIEENDMLQGRNRVCLIDQYVKVFRKVGLVLRPDQDAEELVKMLRDEFVTDAIASRKRFMKRKKSEDWSVDDLDTPDLIREESTAPEIT